MQVSTGTFVSLEQFCDQLSQGGLWNWLRGKDFHSKYQIDFAPNAEGNQQVILREKVSKWRPINLFVSPTEVKDKIRIASSLKDLFTNPQVLGKIEFRALRGKIDVHAMIENLKMVEDSICFSISDKKVAETARGFFQEAIKPLGEIEKKVEAHDLAVFAARLEKYVIGAVALTALAIIL